MEGVQVACGQITWGRSAQIEQVLAEIAEAGFDGAPGRMFPDQPAKYTADLYARFGLKPAPGYLGVPFWNKDEWNGLIERGKQMAAFAREVGVSELYVASNLTPERRAIAGQVTRETATSVDDIQLLAELLNKIGTATKAEGVSIAFHNHVGSPIETRWEIDQLFARVDRSVVFQGADIGHLAWAGDDIVQFTKDYASSIKTLHIKDIDPKVCAEGVAKKWDYKGFSDHGIFAELGEGMVDFPSMFEALKKAGFKGWIVVETDVTQKATPLISAKISRNYLKSIGV